MRRLLVPLVSPPPPPHPGAPPSLLLLLLPQKLIDSCLCCYCCHRRGHRCCCCCWLSCRHTFNLLTSKFDLVAFVPGNHELWVRWFWCFAGSSVGFCWFFRACCICVTVGGG